MTKLSKTLTVYLILFCVSITLTGCNKSSSQISSSSLPVTEKSPTPVEPVKAPEVYDVICFQAMGLMIDRTMCSPDETYKVLRDTQVTVYLDKQTSVQQGTNTIVSFKYKDKNNGPLQKVTIPEMESLASGGANIYSMYYHNMPVMSGPNQHYVEVQLFNNQNGGFKMFDQDKTQVVFATGDTKIRVEKPSRKSGLMGDMQAVQNGGMYEKKLGSVIKPATTQK